MSQNKSDETAALTPEQQVIRNLRRSRQLMKKLRASERRTDTDTISISALWNESAEAIIG
jgi:hypothetical protein